MVGFSAMQSSILEFKGEGKSYSKVGVLSLSFVFMLTWSSSLSALGLFGASSVVLLVLFSSFYVGS